MTSGIPGTNVEQMELYASGQKIQESAQRKEFAGNSSRRAKIAIIVGVVALVAIGLLTAGFGLIPALAIGAATAAKLQGCTIIGCFLAIHIPIPMIGAGIYALAKNKGESAKESATAQKEQTQNLQIYEQNTSIPEDDGLEYITEEEEEKLLKELQRSAQLPL